MKRFMPAALAAAILLTPAALAGIRGYQYAPAYRPDAPKLAAPVAGSYDGIHTVAVLSAAGTRFELEDRGAAGTRRDTLDISAWKLDDRIEATVRTALHGKFAFVTVPYDRAKLAPPKVTGAAPQLEAALKDIPAKVDAFIVVRPTSHGGLALQSALNRETILWVDFEIAVVDARSLKVIASSTARVQPPDAPHPNFPGLVVGKDFALDSSLTVTPENREKLRLLTGEMLTVTLTETLRSLKLGS